MTKNQVIFVSDEFHGREKISFHCTVLYFVLTNPYNILGPCIQLYLGLQVFILFNEFIRVLYRRILRLLRLRREINLLYLQHVNRTPFLYSIPEVN